MGKIDEVLAIERLHSATKSIRSAEQAERERQTLKVRYAAEGLPSRRFARAEALVTRRAYWARYLAAHAGLPGCHGWEHFLQEGRPRPRCAAAAPRRRSGRTATMEGRFGNGRQTMGRHGGGPSQARGTGAWLGQRSTS